MHCSERDAMVHQEQYRDMIRDAQAFRMARDASPSLHASRVRALLVLPVLLVSLGVKLLNLIVHIGRHRPAYHHPHFQ